MSNVIKVLERMLQTYFQGDSSYRHFLTALTLLNNLPLKIQGINTNSTFDALQQLNHTFSSDFFFQEEFTRLSLDCLQDLPSFPKNEFDFYASLLLENFLCQENNKTGTFYTPQKYADFMLEAGLKKLHPKSILDPASGSGIFLKTALTKLSQDKDERLEIAQTKLFALDRNPLASQLCKILTLLKCFEGLNTIDQALPNLDKNFACGNALIAPQDLWIANQELEVHDWKNQKFDLILCNPPFGLSRDQQISPFENKALKQIYAQYFPGKLNKYLLFMARCYELLSAQGKAIIITPDAWLGVAQAERFRGMLIKEKALSEVHTFEEKMFPDLSVETLITILSKQASNKLQLNDTTIEYPVLNNLPAKIVPTFWKKGFNSLINKIQANSFALDEKFQPLIALQVYTTGKGTPPQSAEVVKTHPFHSEKKISKEHLPYLQGKDVGRFEIDWSGEYLHYGPWVAEFQPIVRYQQPRVLVREILGSTPYLFQASYTEDCYLYNRSILHILATQTSPELLEALCSVLNSKLGSFWLLTCGRKSRRKIFPKIVLDDLKSFPVPNNLQLTEKSNLDHLIYKQYGLNSGEIELIEASLSGN